LLTREGPAPPFRYISDVSGETKHYVRDLRVQHQGRPSRALYVVDPRRHAILPIGSDKPGRDRWHIERRAGAYVSTLRNFVSALDGELELAARFPDGGVRISSLSDEQHVGMVEEYAQRHPAKFNRNPAASAPDGSAPRTWFRRVCEGEGGAIGPSLVGTSATGVTPVTGPPRVPR